MSTISNNGGTVSSSLLATMNPSSSSSSTSDVQTAQNNFLTLLVTQMKNQDPMNPMDNAQVTSQMAQLSTVTGINQLNASMTALSSSYQTSQNLQAATLIGRTVVAPGNNMYLSGSSATFGVTLPANANNVTVTIKNAAGQTVNTVNAGSLSAGDNKLSWDGTMSNGAAAPAGTYTFSVAASASGQSLAATGIEYGTVASVVSNSSGVKLNLANNLGQINLSDIKQVS